VTTKLTPTAEQVAAMKIPPEVDTAALKVIAEAKKISTSIGIIKTAPLGTGKNVASGAGFPNKKTRAQFFIPAKDITDLGKDGTFVSPSSGRVWNTFKTTLAHEPIGRIYIMIHPPVADRDKILQDPGPYTRAQQKSGKKYIGRHFNSRYGIHMFPFISTYGKGTIGNLYVKVSGKEISFASFTSLVDHPGNIDSGGNNAGGLPSGGAGRLFLGQSDSELGESLDGPTVFRCYGRDQPSVSKGPHGGHSEFRAIFRDDTEMNTLFKGTAVHISYDYLDNYDADVAT
jgi:hypothetical protein